MIRGGIGSSAAENQLPRPSFPRARRFHVADNARPMRNYVNYTEVSS